MDCGTVDAGKNKQKQADRMNDCSDMFGVEKMLEKLIVANESSLIERLF